MTYLLSTQPPRETYITTVSLTQNITIGSRVTVFAHVSLVFAHVSLCVCSLCVCQCTTALICNTPLLRKRGWFYFSTDVTFIIKTAEIVFTFDRYFSKSVTFAREYVRDRRRVFQQSKPHLVLML